MSPSSRAGQVVLLGPLPPPRSGTTLTFQAFHDAWRSQYPCAGAVIDTSPGQLMPAGRRMRLADLRRGVRIAAQLWRAVPEGGGAACFLNSGLYARLGGYLDFLRRSRKARLAVFFFGSGLFDALASFTGSKRRRVSQYLRRLDGLIVETDYLRVRLREQFDLHNAETVPGFRFVDWNALPERKWEERPGLRLVYLSQIRPEKGALVLLDALHGVADRGCAVQCDFFGPLGGNVGAPFLEKVAHTPGARYAGTAQGNVPALLAEYDALVMPSWYAGEGHSGVIIEAMMAGIPAITTRHQALPELVDDGVNGLLVEPRSAPSLAEAIGFLAANPARLPAMGAEHRARLRRHDARNAAARFAEILHV